MAGFFPPPSLPSSSSLQHQSQTYFRGEEEAKAKTLISIPRSDSLQIPCLHPSYPLLELLGPDRCMPQARFSPGVSSYPSSF